jgi:parallel beta-helix repeat protein
MRQKWIAEVVFATLLLLLPGVARATDWYVDGAKGNDGNSGTSQSAAFLDWNYALSKAQPGDTVHLLPTIIYGANSSGPGGITISSKSGSSEKFIVFQGDGVSPNLTEISGIGTGNGLLIENSSYIQINNLSVTAPSDSNQQGFSGVAVQNANNIVIDSNYIHDSGGSGVQTTQSDYIEIANNTIYNNAWDTSAGIFGSGIKMEQNTDIDVSTAVKMMAIGNIIALNHNIPRQAGESCSTFGDQCSVYGADSDGNGIVVDNNNGSVPATGADPNPSPGPIYGGRTLIANNVVFNNGGRGIHVSQSNHVDIVNNTTFHNNTDPYESLAYPGEIMAVASGDLNVYNNIVYGDGGVTQHNPGTGTHFDISFETGAGAPIFVGNNLGYNATNNASSFIYMPATGSAESNNGGIQSGHSSNRHFRKLEGTEPGHRRLSEQWRRMRRIEWNYAGEHPDDQVMCSRNCFGGCRLWSVVVDMRRTQWRSCGKLFGQLGYQRSLQLI